MEFFRFRKDIPFMQRALIFNAISLLTFLAAVFFSCTGDCICRWSSPAVP